jgi:DNA-binding transcriptional MerR regulator
VAGAEHVTPPDAPAGAKKGEAQIPHDAEGKPMPRASDDQLSQMGGPFRDKVFVDATLGEGDVLVRYQTKNGVVTDVHIAVGTKATAADIRQHRATAEYIQRYSGLTGRARILLDQIRNWFREPGRKIPDFGTRAWELRLELEKLHRMIDERNAEIDKIVKEGRKPIDEARLKELNAEIDNLEGQLQGYAKQLGAMSADPALGYVAARGLSAGAELARQLNLPDPPEGYVWRIRGNDVHPFWRGKTKGGGTAKAAPEAGAKKPASGEDMVEGWDKVKEAIDRGEPPTLTWDDKAKKFKVADTSGKETPFEAGTKKEDAFIALGGEDDTKPLYWFLKMLKEQKLLASDDDFIKQMQEPAGLTPRTVRHNAKQVYLDLLIAKITDKKVIAQTETYKNLIKEGKTPEQAHRMASHERMLEVTKDLASADRGSIGERWFGALYGAGDTQTQVSVTVKRPDEHGVLKDEQRNIDRMEGTTARELKNVSGEMGARETGQIHSLIAAIGSDVVVNGQPRKIEKVIETFVDPRGEVANADFMKQIFKTYPDANVTFELYTARGEVITVDKNNFETVLGDGLAASLGVSAK